MSTRAIKQAVIAVLCEHPEQDKYKKLAFSSDSLDVVSDALANPEINKADLFVPDADGKYVVDTPGFWKNFEKIAALVQASGDAFELQDFLKPIGRPENRTLLETAREEKSVGKIFTEEVWKGRFDEMERVWYRLPLSVRRETGRNDGLINADFKRAMLALENKKMPEDALEAAGLKLSDVFNAFSDRGNYEELKKKLAQNNDYLRKDYILLRDNIGDTPFSSTASWGKYEDVIKNLKAHGERMEVADFIRQVGNPNNILARSAEGKALHRVFNPDHWEGRLREMLDLWSYVLPGWKSGSLNTREFDQAYADAESKTFGQTVGKIKGKADILRVLNADGVAAGEKPVLTLGLKSFWNSFSAADQALQASGEKLTLAELRQPSGEMGLSCLMGAAKFGQFSKVVDISKKSGEVIALDDYLAKDRHGNTLLNILAERNELSAVFKAELWVGRVNEMKTLWTHVKIGDRIQISSDGKIDQIEVATRQATLRQQSRNKFRFPGAP